MQAEMASRRQATPAEGRQAERRGRPPAGRFDARPAVVAQQALAERLNAGVAQRQARRSAPLVQRGPAPGVGVAQRAVDLQAVRQLGGGQAAESLEWALAQAQGQSRQLLELARTSGLFDLVFETFEGKPFGRTELRYRAGNERIDLEQAQRPDPVRARSGGLVMRIGVNPTLLTSQGALLQTLTHEIGVHAAAFAPHLQALLHGSNADQAADTLAYELEDPGLLSGSVQHLLLAGDEAADYNELRELLLPNLAGLREDFLSADQRDRLQEQQLARVTVLRSLVSERAFPGALQRALARLGLVESEDTARVDFPTEQATAPSGVPSLTPAEPTLPDFSSLFGLAETVTALTTAPSPVEPEPWVNLAPVPAPELHLPAWGRQQEAGPLPSLSELGLASRPPQGWRTDV